jgi:hypothetical protein
MKNRILLGTGALVVVAIPAVLGLWGNASFAESVPVRVPTQAVTVTPSPSSSPDDGLSDDHGGDVPRDDRTEPGDDRDAPHGEDGPSSAPSPSAPSPSPSADDRGGDDRGGDDDGDHGGDDHGGDDHGGDD